MSHTCQHELRYAGHLYEVMPKCGRPATHYKDGSYGRIYLCRIHARQKGWNQKGIVALLAKPTDEQAGKEGAST